MDRKCENFNTGRDRLNLTSRLHPCDMGHIDIHYNHIYSHALDHLNRFLSVAGDPCNFKIRLLLQNPANAISNDFMVVSE